MTPSEYKERYAGLTLPQVRELVKTDAAFRKQTEDLYVSVFRAKLNKGCSDCWLDAYVLLIKTDISQIMEKQKTKFELRAGALLIDVVNHDNAKMASRHNITDELALYHLSTNPRYLKFFTRVPENLDELLAQYAAKQKADAEPAEAASGAAETTEEAEGDKGAAGEEKVAENALKSAEDALKKARTVAKSAKTKLENLESAEQPDEKKVAYARESLEKANAALEKAEEAYREASEAAADGQEQPEAAAEQAEQPEQDGEKAQE